MLICIIGKSGSGKDTIARLLQEKYNLKAVCSYTSRSIRDSEIEGREHYFITREKAEEILQERADEVVAKTEINGNLYFALKENLEEADIYIIDPDGIRYLKDHFPDIEVYQIYVYCDDKIAMERARSRGDNMSVYLSRHNSENAMFESYYKSGEYDALIDNSAGFSTVENDLVALFTEDLARIS